MKIAVIPNLTRENAFYVTKNVLEELTKVGAEVYFCNEFQNELECLNVSFLNDDDLYTLCDIVISIGGDGSIIHCAYNCAKYGKKILGINAGRLAFMAGLEAGELNLLKNLIDGNFVIDNRMMLEVYLFESEKCIMKNYCINDVVLARGNNLKMCDFSVKCNETQAINYYSDGVIISTPTGSTAYALSAGGPVIDPTIESISVTPICSHSMFSRSIIFKPDSVIEINAKSRQNADIILSFDGESPIKLGENNKVLIKKADFSAQFIRIKSDTFLDILSYKLSQRKL